MKVGTFRLTYAYSEGGRRYEYDVRPDTAGFVAAAMLYREKMEKAIQEASIAKAQEPLRGYTKRQRDVLARQRQELAAVGLPTPIWWQNASSWDVSQAAIDAMNGTP